MWLWVHPSMADRRTLTGLAGVSEEVGPAEQNRSQDWHPDKQQCRVLLLACSALDTQMFSFSLATLPFFFPFLCVQQVFFVPWGSQKCWKLIRTTSLPGQPEALPSACKVGRAPDQGCPGPSCLCTDLWKSLSDLGGHFGSVTVGCDEVWMFYSSCRLYKLYLGLRISFSAEVYQPGLDQCMAQVLIPKEKLQLPSRVSYKTALPLEKMHFRKSDKDHLSLGWHLPPAHRELSVCSR